jgi:hypothetical protein
VRSAQRRLSCEEESSPWRSWPCSPSRWPPTFAGAPAHPGPRGQGPRLFRGERRQKERCHRGPHGRFRQVCRTPKEDAKYEQAYPPAQSCCWASRDAPTTTAWPAQCCGPLLLPHTGYSVVNNSGVSLDIYQDGIRVAQISDRGTCCRSDPSFSSARATSLPWATTLNGAYTGTDHWTFLSGLPEVWSVGKLYQPGTTPPVWMQ